jgi:predicted permease
METLLQDARYGLRMLVKNPVFTTIAVLTLALGIGANTAIFTLVNAVLLKMLPIKDPQHLVALGDPTRVNDRSLGTPQTDLFSYPLYREFRDGNTVFSGMYAAGMVHKIAVQQENQSSPGEADALMRLVTGNYFSVLGTNAVIGRTLNPEDDKVQHASPVAVLSYKCWKNRFGLSGSVIGKTVRLNNYPFTIVGVTQPGFFGDVVGDEVDFFAPLSMQAEVMRGRDWYNDRNASWLQIVARLKPGTTIAQAKAQINVVYQQILYGPFGAALDPEDLRSIRKRTIDVVPGARGLSEIRGDYQTPLLLLMGIVGLVLLIACVNVANLLLARASSRNKEVAVRLAIGAGPKRIVRQLLTESVVLAFMGGVIGSLVAIGGVKVLVKIVNAELVTRPDLRVFAFSAGICLVTGILFGLVPALRLVHVSLTPALKELPTGDKSHSRWTWGKGLVAGQVALSLFVLFAAGLLVRSLRNLEHVDTGYSQDHLLLVRIDAIAAGYTRQQIMNLAHELLDKLPSTPGVRAVTLSENGLFSGTEGADAIAVVGVPQPPENEREARNDLIAPNYFSTLGIPILLGRDIGPQDTDTSPRVAVINQSMAKFYFRNENPIGRRFYVDDLEHRDQLIEIVGVVPDSKQNALTKPPARRYYRPFFQETERSLMMNLEIRTFSDPAAVTNDIRREIQSIDPQLAITRIRTLPELIDSSIAGQIALARLSAFFAGLALLLACIGLYGIMSYTVSGRTREIGVRMALGARRADVLWLVLAEALLLVGTGIVIGIPAALAGSRVLSATLFGLKPSDPISLGIVTLMLITVAALASYVPAWRATRIDPMVALRYE